MVGKSLSLGLGQHVAGQHVLRVGPDAVGHQGGAARAEILLRRHEFGDLMEKPRVDPRDRCHRVHGQPQAQGIRHVP
jgi:hypothetical protein